MLKKIILLLCFSKIIFGKTFYCFNNNKTNVLNPNEVGFFQTTNFPTLLSPDEIELCNFNFSMSHKNITNFNTFITFYFMLEPFIEPNIKYIIAKNVSNISLFEIYDGFQNFGSAIQGMIIFDTWINSCPMESISRNSPLLINDETQTIYIQSSFYKNKHRRAPCKWKFMAPNEEYGFKIVILKLNISDSTKLIIKNSTNVFLNNRDIEFNYPYYNSDMYLEINLSKGNPDFITTMEFRAYISIVRKNIEKNTANCILSTENSYKYWSLNFDTGHVNGKGYGNNEYCSYNLVIPENRTYVAEILILSLESSSDYLKYYYDNEEGTIVTDVISLIFDPYTNGTDRLVKWEFVSDGSLPALGFYIGFREIGPCECNNYKMHCNQSYQLMLSDNNDLYCNNLRCKFIIVGCNETILTKLRIKFGDGYKLNDKITVFSNDQLIKEITEVSQEREIVDVYLNSRNLNFLYVETYSSVEARQMLFEIDSFAGPKIDLFIILSQNKPVYLMDTKFVTYALIYVSDNLKSQNYTITVTSNLKYSADVFNNQSLTTSLLGPKCFGKMNPFTCEINSNKLVLNPKPVESGLFDIYYSFLVTKLSAPSKECVMKQNIYFLNKEVFHITGIATAAAECYIYILVENQMKYYISNLWTTSTKKYVKVFIGLDQTHLYFQFNSKSAKKWQNIGFNSKVYTIIIPPKASIHIILKSYNTDNDEVLKLDFSYKSIFATPFYGTSKSDYPIEQYFIAYNLKNTAAKFTIFHYKMFQEDIFNFFTLTDYDWENPNQFFVNKTGEILMFENETVYVEYISGNDSVGDNFFGAVILVETFKIQKEKRITT